MESTKLNFDPDKPQDVLMYLCLLEELFSQGRSGADRAAAACMHMASSDTGRKLLSNCQLLLSDKIEKHLDRSVFRAQHNMLNMVRRFASYQPSQNQIKHLM